MNDWTTQAACAGTDTELFFSTEPGDMQKARDTCITCPVVAECFQMAIDTHTFHGVFGATTGYQRARIMGRAAS